jgi:hypothetical protein
MRKGWEGDRTLVCAMQYSGSEQRQLVCDAPNYQSSEETDV